MMAHAERRLIAGFERALDRGELHMLYQPKVRLDTGFAGSSRSLVRSSRRGSCR